MPKFTDEQIERAKNIDVRTFLEQTEGFIFQQSGKYLKCRDPERTGQPSSLSIDTSLNRIFYNSVTGNRPLSAIDWCKDIKKMDFQSSIRLILGESPQGKMAEKPKYQQFTPQPKVDISKAFVLPEKTDKPTNVKAYLNRTRGIANHIINYCLKHDLIYQDIHKNAVFVGKDDNGQPKYAARRGTFTPDGKEPFKRDSAGSDKDFAFKLVGKDTETIYVTEAAIDALSLATLEDKFNGEWSHRNKTYISTGGAGIDNAIEQFCKTHTVKTINICFDNDEAGKNGMEKIMQKFRAMGYEVNDMRASLAHDYNDELTEFNKNPDFYPEPPLPIRAALDKTHERTDNMPEIDISVNENQETEKNEKEEHQQCLFSLEHHGEKVEYMSKTDNLFDILNAFATSEKPFVSMAEKGNIISNSKAAEIEQGDNFGFSANINIDENSLSLFNGEHLKVYPLDRIVGIVHEIANENLSSEEREKSLLHRLTEYSADTEHTTQFDNFINEDDIPPEPSDYYAQYGIPSEHKEHTVQSSENISFSQPETEQLSHTNEQALTSQSVTEQAISKSESINQETTSQKQPIEQHSIIFGNMAYNKIPDKEHIPNIDPLLSVNIFKRIQEENIAFSGKLTENGIIVAVSKENSQKVKSIIREETELLRQKEKHEHKLAPKDSVQQTNGESVSKKQIESNAPEPKLEEKKYEQSTPVTETVLEQMKSQDKMNLLLASMKDSQETRRANILDKIDSIDEKIQRHQERITKLNAKVADLETSLKTSYAFKRAFGNTAIGKLIDKSIEKKQAQIAKIREVKIPKREDKIRKQNLKKSKENIKLGKVNRKIDKIDKVQDFLNDISSKDGEERHRGFIKGLENLSDIHRETLENKSHTLTSKISDLTAQYNSPDISHRERLEIGKKINSLRVKSVTISEKIKGMDKLHSDLEDMKNGKFTEEQINNAVNKTSDKLSEKLENAENTENQSMIDSIIETSVQSGSEAISEVSAENIVEYEKIKPTLEREKIQEERQPDVTKDTEKQILIAVSVITGIDISELNRLPAEIKSDIIAEYQENNGNIPTEKLVEKICDIADIKPPETLKQSEPVMPKSEEKEKENPLRQIEDMLEENDNYFDGMLNNLPADKPKDKGEPLFSRSRVMSDEFKPTSEMSQDDTEQDKSKKKNHGISL